MRCFLGKPFVFVELCEMTAPKQSETQAMYSTAHNFAMGNHAGCGRMWQNSTKWPWGVHMPHAAALHKLLWDWWAAVTPKSDKTARMYGIMYPPIIPKSSLSCFQSGSKQYKHHVQLFCAVSCVTDARTQAYTWLSVNRQMNLTVSHLHICLDPFASLRRYDKMAVMALWRVTNTSTCAARPPYLLLNSYHPAELARCKECYEVKTNGWKWNEKTFTII